MSRQTHKQWLNHLKTHDPITFSEFTSDPSGANNDDSIQGCLSFFIIAIIVSALLIYLLN